MTPARFGKMPIGIQSFEKLRTEGFSYIDKTENIYRIQEYIEFAMLVKTPLYIYVMEFKLDGTAEEALAQIKSKDYSLPFTVEGEKVIKIGMNFSEETRNIENWVVE